MKIFSFTRSPMKVFVLNFTEINYRAHYRKNAKLRQMGSWRGHMTYF